MLVKELTNISMYGDKPQQALRFKRSTTPWWSVFKEWAFSWRT